MPRPTRISVANGCYHVLNRGNGLAKVFHKKADYEAFVRLVGFFESRTQSAPPRANLRRGGLGHGSYALFKNSGTRCVRIENPGLKTWATRHPLGENGESRKLRGERRPAGTRGARIVGVLSEFSCAARGCPFRRI